MHNLFFQLLLFVYSFVAVTNMNKGLIHQTSTSRIDEWHTIDVSKKEKILIHITQDSLYNLFITAYDEEKNVYGSQAVMFSDVNRNPKLISALQLDDTTEEKEFVIRSFDKGSTYGAQSLFIIWYDKYTWHVTRDIFQRAMLEDRNKDGIYEIVEYFGGLNNKGKIYRFRSGNFLEF